MLWCYGFSAYCIIVWEAAEVYLAFTSFELSPSCSCNMQRCFLVVCLASACVFRSGILFSWCGEWGGYQAHRRSKSKTQWPQNSTFGTKLSCNCMHMLSFQKNINHIKHNPKLCLEQPSAPQSRKSETNPRQFPVSLVYLSANVRSLARPATIQLTTWYKI